MIDEAGRTASSIAESMKGSPSCLAAILLAALFALLTYYSLETERTEMHERQLAIISRCIPLPQPGHE